MLRPPSTTIDNISGISTGVTCEVDPDFVEHVRREASQEPELPWDD